MMLKNFPKSSTMLICGVTTPSGGTGKIQVMVLEGTVQKLERLNIEWVELLMKKVSCVLEISAF